MNKFIFIIPVSLLVLSSCSSSDIMVQKPTLPKEGVMEKTVPANAMMRKDTNMTGTNNSMMRKEVLKKPQGYMNYSSNLLDSGRASKQNVVLFFAASWCPTCRALEQNIMLDLSLIPANALILKVNFDDSSELRQKYGVVAQHTTVVLNSDGSLKSKKLGARNISEIFAQ